jgi:hypothetical protein
MAIRARLLALPAGVVATALAASLLLAACSSSTGTDTPSTTSASSGSSSPTTAAPPTSQTVAMGRKQARGHHRLPRCRPRRAEGDASGCRTHHLGDVGSAPPGVAPVGGSSPADGGTAPETESWVEGVAPPAPAVQRSAAAGVSSRATSTSSCRTARQRWSGPATGRRTGARSPDPVRVGRAPDRRPPGGSLRWAAS